MNTRTLSKSNLVIGILLLTAITIPIATPFDFSFVYLVYIGALTLLLVLAPPKNVKKLVLQQLLPAFTLYSALVICHASDISSIINLSALLLTWTLIVLISDRLKSNPNNLISTINLLPKFMLFSIVLYFPLSILFSSSLDISNPLSDVLNGNRLRLLSSENTGHSVLITLSFLGLILCYSKISTFSGKLRWPATIFFLALLVLSKSSTSWLLILSSTTIYIIELARQKIGKLATLGYVLVGLLSITAIFNLQDLLTIFRSDLQGNDTSIYSGDLTAGRADLNALLLAGISKAPLSGLGHGHATLQTGIKDASGRGANSESGLRLAAKYGIPYFLAILFIVCLPFRAFSLKDKKIRTLSISFSTGLLLMMTANATLEAPHSFEFFFFICLALILSSTISAHKSQSQIKPPTLAPNLTLA